MMMYDGHRLARCRGTFLLIGIIVFLIATIVFLFNMFITSEDASIAMDFAGLRPVEACEIIVEMMLALRRMETTPDVLITFSYALIQT